MPKPQEPELSEAASCVTADEANAAIGRIAASGVLGQSSRLEALLRYVVQEEREGRGDRIKAYSVATDVLGRGQGFDPSVDSIVRVEFRRLRQALNHYYATAGSGETTVINIPLGSYRPEFTQSDRASARPPPQDSPRQPAVKWIAAAGLLVVAAMAFFAFEALNGMPNLRSLIGVREDKLIVALDPIEWSGRDPTLVDDAASIHKQLLVNMARFRFLSIVDGSQVSAARRPDVFTLKVQLQRSPTSVRMVAELVDPYGVVGWGQIYDTPAEIAANVHDVLTARLLADLRPRIFIGARRFYDRMKTDPAPRNVWAAFIRSTWVSANQVTSLRWEEERIALARQALRAKPDFGPAHSLLAQKLSYLFAVDTPHDTPKLRQQAAWHANRAMDLDAADPDTVFNVGLYHWNVGQVEASLVALRRTVELDPNHALAQALIGPIEYFCKPVPQAEIANIRRMDEELSPDSPFRWVVHSFLSDAYGDNDDWPKAEAAARESQQMMVSPDTFLRLILALRKNGKSTEAEVIRAHQRGNWPGLDLRHYARVTYADRCGSTPYTEERIRLFGELAADAKGD